MSLLSNTRLQYYLKVNLLCSYTLFSCRKTWFDLIMFLKKLSKEFFLDGMIATDRDYPILKYLTPNNMEKTSANTVSLKITYTPKKTCSSGLKYFEYFNV